MKNLFILTLFFVSVAHYSFSQNVKESDEYLNKAMISMAENDVVSSEKLLKKSIKENTENYNSYSALGDLYFKIGKYKSAIINYQHSDLINPSNYLKYKLGDSYFMDGDYLNAKKQYEIYLLKAPSHYKTAKTAKKRLDNCNFAFDAMKNPKKIKVYSVGEGINTSGYEYNPVVTADGTSLIYTGVRLKQGRKVEDIYISKLKYGEWQTGIPLSGYINTNDNEGAHCISADGKLLYFTSCGRKTGLGSCDIYVSVKVRGKWSAAINLGNRVNTASWDAHPAISPDGSTLIFSSTRAGGQGKKDLWMVKYSQGNWSIPKNLSELNTKGNEVTPFLHVDGSTLYFSSDGLPGMGGTDFFVSRYDEELRMWGEPVNLGYSINTSRDEYSLSVARDGKTAYFATGSVQDNGNLNIYNFELNGKIRSNNTAYLKGKIIEITNNKNIVDSDLLILDLNTSKPINSVYVNDGNYVALLPVGKTYAIVAKSPKHLLYSTTFEFMTDTISNFLEKNIKLQRFRKGAKMNLNNVNYESGKAELLKESYFELDLLVTYLKKYSKYRVKIIGHTDDVGTNEYNYKLSLDRANSVREYLVSKGIKPAKLKSFGKGETQPISKNETDKGRKLNRRTEIILY